MINLEQIMSTYLKNVTAGFGFSDVVDILLVAFLIYEVLVFIRKTRAEQLVKGLLLLGLATVFSGALNLYTLHWICKGTITLGVIALVVIFQPELRSGLEYLGTGGGKIAGIGRIDQDDAKRMASEVAKAAEAFSVSHTGALMVFERSTMLSDIIENGGTKVDAELSAHLLGNIFYEGAPLHDGAVVIRGGRLYAAGCVLPLTKDKSLSKDLGTRHRAGIGITEVSDAFVVIVSEETGIISVAEGGKLSRFLDSKTVEKKLLDIFFAGDSGKKGFLKALLGGKRNVSE